MQLIITDGTLKCPECGSDNNLRINNIELCIEEETVSIPCYCDDCQNEWADVYQYSHMETLY